MDDDSGSGKDRFGPYRGARMVLLSALAATLATTVPFAAQSSSLAQFISVATIGVSIALAAIVGGGLIGFIFGIPRSVQEGRVTPPDGGDGGGGSTLTTTAGSARGPAYAGNTSLEQISDWLTKILVGVGLTQLANLPSGLDSLSDFLAPGLGNLPGSDVYAIGLVMASVLIGFFLSYLWTRLWLPSLFAEADVRAALRQAEEEGHQRGEAEALRASSAAVAQAGPATRGAEDETVLALWVNDEPASKTLEEGSLNKLLGVEFETVTSTEAAMAALNDHPDRYAFVISDIQRGRDNRAGYDLLERMKAAGITTPIIFYTRYTDPTHDTELRKLGAVGATNSASKLIELVSGVLKRDVPG